MPISEARLRQLRDLLTHAAIDGNSGVPFFLHDLLGEGGQGWVYRAHYDEPDGPWVVVKLLRPDVVNEEALSRFLREADVLRKLGQAQAPCPSVVRFYDHGIFRYAMPDGEVYALPFTVLEYVHGTTLAQVLEASEGRGLGVDRVRRMFRQVARALMVVHAAQIVHRDLKPSNILIASEAGQESVKISDFGLVKRFDVDIKGTIALAGASVGYAPPEQFEMGNRRVSARTDVFAFASVLYEALAGRPAFPSTPVETAFQIVSRVLTGPRPQLSQSAGTLSPELAGRADLLAALDRELERAMRADPGERHESIRELWEAVEPLLRAATDRGAPGLSRMPTRTDGPAASGAASSYPASSVPVAAGRRRPETAPMPSRTPSEGQPSFAAAEATRRAGAGPAWSDTARASSAPPALLDPPTSPHFDPPTQQVSSPRSHEMPSVAPPSRIQEPFSSYGPPPGSRGLDPVLAQDPRGSVYPLPSPGSPGLSPSLPPQGAAPVSFRKLCAQLLPERARIVSLSPDGKSCFALGRAMLYRFEPPHWMPFPIQSPIDPGQIWGLLAAPGGDLVLFGERGLLIGVKPDGTAQPWAPPDYEVTWTAASITEAPSEILLVGEHPVRRTAVLGLLRPGQPLARRGIEGVGRLLAVTRLSAETLLACGEGGELVTLTHGQPTAIPWGRTGHLAAAAATGDGGAFVVGSGGHAIRVTPGREARLEPVQTTHDLCALAIGASGVPWAGGSDGRLVSRTPGGWLRVPLPAGTSGEVRALHAGPAFVLAVLDDGGVLEGALT